MVLVRGQQGCKLFDNLSAFRQCFFMNTLPILMKISAFSMRVAPIFLFLISAPPPFLAHLSQRLIGELIGYPWSGVRPSSVVVRPS